MDRKEEFLTKDILGNLCLRVAKTLPCINFLNDSTIWDKPIELCKRIEYNVREIDNVILEVRKDLGYFQNNSKNPHTFQVLLARVYILLYYRHTDEELYKAMVFPVLQDNMGIYSEKLLGDIQSKVKKVQDIDRLIEKSQQERRQNNKPKYVLIRLNSGEADEYFSEFSNENLFLKLSSYLEDLRSHFFPGFDVASIWLTAKDVVSKLWQEKAPENFIDRLYHKLSMSGGTGYVERGAAEGVLLCGYVMMRTVTKSDHFHKAIAYIEEIPHAHNDYDLLYNEMGSLKELMDHLSSSCNDYDYTGGIQQKVETYTKADVERIFQDKNNQIDQLRIAANKVTVLEQEKDQLGAEKAQLYTENEQLKKEVEALKSNKDEYSNKGIPANQAAVLVQMICHNLGGLPNNIKSLSPVLSFLWGFSESTAERVLGEKLKQETAEKVATIFNDVSPKIRRLLIDFPQEYDNLRKEKLKNNNRQS